MPSIKKRKRKDKDKDLSWALERLEEGDLSSVLAFRSEDSLDGELVRKIQGVARGALTYVDILTDLSQGKYDVSVPAVSRRNQIGTAVAQVVASISRTAHVASEVKVALEAERNKLIQEDWIKSQYTRIFSKIQGIKTLAELGSILLNEVSISVNAQMGAVYFNGRPDSGETVEANILRCLAAYGLQPEQKREFAFGEGLVGQCALDRRIQYIERIPESGFVIESGLGQLRPKCIALLPIIYQNQLYGVLELASVDSFSDIHRLLLEQISSSLGINVRTISGTMLTETLLGEIAKTNNSLASQKQALDYSAIVAETDLRGRITYVNDKFLEISKYTREELLGQDHRILNSRHHPRDFFISLWKTIAAGDVWTGEVKNRAKDGTFYWVDTTIYPVKDERGKLHKYVAIRFDITDKKRAFEELQQATEQARKADKIKTEFLANMSHEIRTPMNAIIGMSDLLKETPLNVDQKRYVGVLNSAGSALLEVINNILDLSKIEAGYMELEKIPFDLEELAYASGEIMAIAAQEKGLEFVVSVQPGLEKDVQGDSSRLRQVLINLMGNAIKFTKKGEVVLRVEMEEDLGSTGRYRISVRDTGIGIPAEKQAKIFDSFSQANTSTTREFGGTGLGLAISKRIVEAMGGGIFLHSEEGKGSEFSFLIELSKTSMKGVPLPAFSEKKVLLLDGNASFRRAIVERLSYWKMDVEEVDSETAAFEALRSAEASGKPFHLMIVDYHLAGGGALALAKKVGDLALPNRVSCLMTLKSTDKRTGLGRLVDNGVGGFVVKPVRSLELSQAIEEVLAEQKTKYTVLVVDDEEDVRDLVAEFLGALPVQVLKAANGKEALELLEKGGVHTVLADVKMPEMDGIELLAQARKLGHHIPFVFLSGHLDSENLSAVSTFGSVSLMEKPFNGSALLDLVEESIAHSARTTPVEAEPSPAVTAVSMDKRKILLVDDVKENIDLLKVYLAPLSLDVTSAANGQEAVTLFESNQYDLIFMDLQMPVLDGREATRRIRTYEKTKGLAHTPIVVLSAHALTEEIQASFDAGCDGYLTKPIRKMELLSAIQKYAPTPKKAA